MNAKIPFICMLPLISLQIVYSVWTYILAKNVLEIAGHATV